MTDLEKMAEDITALHAEIRSTRAARAQAWDLHSRLGTQLNKQETALRDLDAEYRQRMGWTEKIREPDRDS